MNASPVQDVRQAVTRYDEVRAQTELLAAPRGPEDQTVRSMADVSPTKWHRARDYRRDVDVWARDVLGTIDEGTFRKVAPVVELGFHHEQQQELRLPGSRARSTTNEEEQR